MRQYEYPTVHEIEVPREQVSADPFGDFGTLQKATVRLSTHFESLADHYDAQYGSAMHNLGRALLQESGQLALDFGPPPETESEAPLFISPEPPRPLGPPPEIPEVKKCTHAECDCE